MRLFVAIGVDLSNLETLQKSFTRMRREVKEKEWDVLFTPPKSFHITLRFLGEQTEQDLEVLKSIIEEVGDSSESFELLLSGMGAFPEIHQARVFWIGVQNKKNLQALHSLLLMKINNVNTLASEESYEPHLTIGRLRNPRSLKNFLSPFVRKEFGKIKVESIGIYKSLHQGNYPKYELLHEAKLQASKGP